MRYSHTWGMNRSLYISIAYLSVMPRNVIADATLDRLVFRIVVVKLRHFLRVLAEISEQLSEHFHGFSLLFFGGRIVINSLKQKISELIRRVPHLGSHFYVVKLAASFNDGRNHCVDSVAVGVSENLRKLARDIVLFYNVSAHSIVDIVIDIRNSVGELYYHALRESTLCFLPNG